jgi:hypothetical protein
MGAEVSEWQDISTAPKDGTQFLAYAPGGPARVPYYGVAQWAEADPDFPNTVSGWFWPFAIRPTKWQPIDEPPND